MTAIGARESYRSVFLTIAKLLKGLSAEDLFNTGATGSLDIADGVFGLASNDISTELLTQIFQENAGLVVPIRSCS